MNTKIIKEKHIIKRILNYDLGLLTNNKVTRCSYKDIDDGIIGAIGMPSHNGIPIPLKRVASYGVPKLKEIIQSKEQIKFKCKYLNSDHPFIKKINVLRDFS